jgi:hypothetical protein
MLTTIVSLVEVIPWPHTITLKLLSLEEHLMSCTLLMSHTLLICIMQSGSMMAGHFISVDIMTVEEYAAILLERHRV